jgi:predicted nuclease of predicted toxin-antitoxin system
MRVLLDENVDATLKDHFDPEFEVVTIRERGWRGVKNGYLLRAAGEEFDVLVKMDKNIEHQQNLTSVRLGIVVIRAYSNVFEDVVPLMPRVNEAVRTIAAGEIVHVSAGG